MGDVYRTLLTSEADQSTCVRRTKEQRLDSEENCGPETAGVSKRQVWHTTRPSDAVSRAVVCPKTNTVMMLALWHVGDSDASKGELGKAAAGGRGWQGRGSGPHAPLCRQNVAVFSA